MTIPASRLQKKTLTFWHSQESVLSVLNETTGRDDAVTRAGDSVTRAGRVLPRTPARLS
jgi:hypothetical protein